MVGGVAGRIPTLLFPIGLLLLVVAFVLALRRTPDVGDRPVQDRGERRRAFFFRLLLLGLAMVLVSLLISVLAGNLSAAKFFAVPVVISVAVAIAVWLSGRFFLGAMILGLLLLFFAFAAFELELQHPESFANFVPALWLALGCAIAFGAAVVALIQRRRRTLRPATPLQRRLVVLGLALLVAGSAVSWFVSGASRVTAARAKGAPVVEMNDNKFLPNALDVRQGERARFYLVNKDSEPHTFTVDDIALDEYIGPLGERLVSFKVPPATRNDTLALTCVVSGHEDMDGTISVEPS
jgi:hypothetical protein